MIIETERLILRPWKEEDFEPFAQLNADKRVREYFSSTLTRAVSDGFANKFKSDIEKNGWGWWAVSVKNSAPFIGFIGLNILDIPIPSHSTSPVEIGWRLAVDYWGKGYATEGALACLRFGFETLKLPEIIAITTEQNFRSISVMKKIGMHRDPKDDFNHPKLPEGHKLRRHVLYRINLKEWKEQNGKKNF